MLLTARPPLLSIRVLRVMFRALRVRCSVPAVAALARVTRRRATRGRVAAAVQASILK